MANNRLFLIHRPSGEAVCLGKRSGTGWHSNNAEPALGERVAEFFRGVGEEGHDPQDDFILALEDVREVPPDGVLWEIEEYWVDRSRIIPMKLRRPTPPMVLHCPVCHVQHIDTPHPVPEWTSPHAAIPQSEKERWTNPPHRSHLCQSCGCQWRPADVPTTGVEKIETRGANDTWPSKPPQVLVPLSVEHPRFLIEYKIGDGKWEINNSSFTTVEGAFNWLDWASANREAWSKVATQECMALPWHWRVVKMTTTSQVVERP